MTSERQIPSGELRLVSGPPAHDADARPLVMHVCADRATLAELTSVVDALTRSGEVRQLVVHTGSDAPATAGLVRIDIDLGLRPGTHAEQTAEALTAFERLLDERRPDVVVLAGAADVTVGAGLAAAKLGIAVAHLPAGRRCWDWTHSEEINRVLIDHLSDTLFTSSTEATDNLLGEGIPDGRVHAIGSTRIDVLRRLEARAQARRAWDDLDLLQHEYLLVLLEQLVGEDAARRDAIVAGLTQLAGVEPVLVVLPARAANAGEPPLAATLIAAGVRWAEIDDHLELLSLQAGAGAILTDAEWAQEESSALGVTCFTLAATTAVPVTLTHGTNVLLGDEPADIAAVRRGPWRPTPAAIPLWDGRAGERAAGALLANYTLAGPGSNPANRTFTLRSPSEEHG